LFKLVKNLISLGTMTHQKSTIVPKNCPIGVSRVRFNAKAIITHFSFD
jgi:hypothetical protein